MINTDPMVIQIKTKTNKEKK